MSRTPVTEEEFTKLSKALAEEVQALNIDFILFQDLQNAAQKYHRVIGQSPAFWNSTLEAHLNSVVLRACRVYDTQVSALGINYWLRLIRDNPKWFTKEAFEARKSNPISSYHGSPNPEQLCKDLEYTDKKTELIDNLMDFRGNMVAHIGQNWIMGRHKKPFKVTHGDLRELIDKAHEILNRYWRLYDSQEFSRTQIGAKDFEYIFHCLHESIQ
jgi:AbiU2